MKEFLKQTLASTLPKSLFNRLLLTKMRLDRKLFPKRVVEHVYGDLRLKVGIEEPVAESWYDHDWTLMEEIKELRKSRLGPGKTVFDVGAHQGIVAMMLAHEVSPGGKVVAVEASPLNARILAENLKRNGVTNVVLEHLAIADEPGTLILNEDSNGQIDPSRALGAIEIPARTIDFLTEKRGQPDVVFVDIEGFECSALRGAKKTLEGKTDWFVEVHVAAGLEKLGGSITEVLSHFPAERFRTYVAGGHVEAEPFREVSRGFFSSNDPLLTKRFFLLAISNG